VGTYLTLADAEGALSKYRKVLLLSESNTPHGFVGAPSKLSKVNKSMRLLHDAEAAKWSVQCCDPQYKRMLQRHISYSSGYMQPKKSGSKSIAALEPISRNDGRRGDRSSYVDSDRIAKHRMISDAAKLYIHGNREAVRKDASIAEAGPQRQGHSHYVSKRAAARNALVTTKLPPIIKGQPSMSKPNPTSSKL